MGAQGERPEAATWKLSVPGSFDCVVARLAHNNSAQDDRVLFYDSERVLRDGVPERCSRPRPAL